MAKPYVIGITGSIAAGKSTVAAMLRRLGAEVIDADHLTHEQLRSGTAVHAAVARRFGPAILAPDGAIDRRALGAIVFDDRAALRDLERLVHPAVIAETLRRLERCAAAVAVIEAIKLLEAEMQRHCDAVWVVTCRREQQLDRLQRERGLSLAQAEQRIDAQAPPETRIARADRVIDNSGDLDDTWEQVVRAWNAIPGVPDVTHALCRTPTSREEGERSKPL